MGRIFLCLYMCSNFLFVISWKPTVDYCKVKCMYSAVAKEEHTACNCKLIEPREEIVDDLVEFRKTIVDKHNELRNKIASGQQKGYPSASNMLAVSYDLELEYIATCHARKFNENHDKCRDKASATGIPGQNLAGSGAPDAMKTGKDVAEMVTAWYNENEYVSGNKAKFIDKNKSSQHKSKKVIGHFTGVVWWSHTMVGCARVHNPKPKSKAFTNSLICNYAGAKTEMASPNMEGLPVYKAGKPCSACPDGTSCSTQYPALCGEIGPIPEGRAGEPSRGSTIHKHKLLVFVCVLLALFKNLRRATLQK